MNLILFGTGEFCKNKVNHIYSNDVIVAYIDNYVLRYKEERLFNGTRVLPPDKIKTLKYDLIIIMSPRFELEIKKQLIELNVDKDKIANWDEYRSIHWLDEEFQASFYFNKSVAKEKKSVLILVHDLGFHGAAMVAVYSAMALKEKGWYCVVAGSSSSGEFNDWLKERGISYANIPILPDINQSLCMWASTFDVVIVNVLPMVECAIKLSGVMPTALWIHESMPEIYKSTLMEHKSITTMQLERINIRAVSDTAKEEYNKYFDCKISKTLTFGIPDVSAMRSVNLKKLTFAIIGSICKNKGQDRFIKAAKNVKCNYVEFVIIGSERYSDYDVPIREMIKDDPRIKYLGELNRREIAEAYNNIDCLVLPSYNDSLSIVTVESMQRGKICIVSKEAGISKYIEDGVNGFLMEPSDETRLSYLMNYIVTHNNEAKLIGERSRKIYDENFTMDSFGDRLDDWLSETITSY